ncbi:MAG: hypothetical protein K8R63_04885 [Bacteroidales bacterium]|nr:hypothetical protein [Bacteroidales bacterium]
MATLKRRLNEFVDYYNNKRYHESLNNITPADGGLELYKGLKGYFHYYNNELAHQGIGRQIPAKLHKKAA